MTLPGLGLAALATVLTIAGAEIAPEVVAPLPGRAEETYLLHCSGCHRADGRGVTDTTPSLHALGPLLATERGRAYLLRVPGVAQAPIDDIELARLLNWVLEEFSGVAPEPPFTADEVAPARRHPLRDPGAERRAIVEAERGKRD